MKNFADKLFASRKTFLFYVISLFALWLNMRVSTSYLNALVAKFYNQHLIGMIKPIDQLLFLESIAKYVFGIQIVLLVLLFISVRRKSLLNTEQSSSALNKSTTLEITFTTLSVLNLSFIFLAILGLNLIFIPSKVLIFVILLTVVVLTITLSYLLKADEDEQFSASQNKTVRYLLNEIKNFGFPYYRYSLFFYFIMIFVLGFIIRQESNEWILVQPIIKSFLFCISIFCVLYFLLGFSADIKRKDEFIRLMIYEQIFTTFLIVVGMFISIHSVAIIFNYIITAEDIMIILGVGMFTSGLFVRAKYQ